MIRSRLICRCAPLKAMLRAERAARLARGSRGPAPRTLLIEKLKLTIKKLRHEQFGQSSERGALLDQLELQLADLEERCGASRGRGADRSGGDEVTVPVVRAAQAGAPSAARAFAARAHRLSGAFGLPMLW